MTLNAPRSALKSTTVSKLMEQGIAQAGLSGQGHSAKYYRPTCAMYVIDAKIDAIYSILSPSWNHLSSKCNPNLMTNAPTL